MPLIDLSKFHPNNKGSIASRLVAEFQFYDRSAGHIEIARTCKVTRKVYSITILEAKYFQWCKGGLVQDVFPDMSADDREFLMSGFTPAEWSHLMGKEEDEDE